MKIFTIISLLFIPVFSWAAVIHVPGEQPTIQAGIDAALSGDTVLVSDGLFTGPGNRDITFRGKAISLVSANGPETTIIDCEESARGFIFANGEQRSSILRGFTITNGSLMGNSTNRIGAGIYCLESSPAIIDCIIQNGLAVEGAGIYSEGGSPLIDSCTIENNLNSNVGAGIAVRGGSPWIVESKIRGNTVNSYGDSVFGAGIFILDASPILSNCIISDNKATDGLGSHAFGGGIFASLTGYFQLTLINCLIESNGALHIMHGNGGFGGGLCCIDGFVSVNSCTFAGNSAATNGGPIYAEGGTDVQLINCISWNNNPEGIHGATRVRYCDVQSGYAGIGNIDLDPLFVAGPLGNYYLAHTETGQPAYSPCIDAGSESAAFT
ncbi:hypothetical protein K8T06_04765, partial [bacterium]|nr:hypothetical protein [bacterium]